MVSLESEGKRRRGNCYLEILGQLARDFFGRRGGAKSGDYLAFFSDQEFREIPADVFLAFLVWVA